jgi:hypothetical protein
MFEHRRHKSTQTYGKGIQRRRLLFDELFVERL